MNKAQVDILLATYNGEKYLPELLASLTQQTEQNFFIRARDDGSNDRSVDILQAFQEKHPDKILLITDEKHSVGSATNYSILLENSTAPYIMFCDQDDVWFPEKISKSMRKIQEIEKEYSPNTPTLVHSDLVVVNQNLELISQSFFKYSGLSPKRIQLNQLLVQNVVTGCATIINRPLAMLATPIPSTAKMHDWWLALVASSTGVIGFLEEATILYRQHTQNTLGANRYNAKYIIEKAKSILNLSNTSILAENFKQSETLQEFLGYHLLPKELEILERFNSIQNHNFWKKRLDLIQYGFTKGKLAQNIGLLLKI